MLREFEFARRGLPGQGRRALTCNVAEDQGETLASEGRQAPTKDNQSPARFVRRPPDNSKRPPPETRFSNIVGGNEQAELPTGTSRPSSARMFDEEYRCAGSLADLSFGKTKT